MMITRHLLEPLKLIEDIISPNLEEKREDTEPQVTPITGLRSMFISKMLPDDPLARAIKGLV